LHLNHTNCHHKIFYTSTYKLLFVTQPEQLRREEAMLHDLIGHSYIRLLEHQPIRLLPQMHVVYIRQHCFGSLWQFLSSCTTILIVFRPWFQLILEMSSILEGRSINSNNLFYKLLNYCEIWDKMLIIVHYWLELMCVCDLRWFSWILDWIGHEFYENLFWMIEIFLLVAC